MNMPKRVTIELTNRCNRLCKGCPRNKMEYPQGDMKWELFKSIVTQLPSSTVIVPFFRGESLLYPRFEDAMQQLQRFNSVQIATNGDMLNERTMKALLSCSFVSLSLHELAYPRWSDPRLEFLEKARKNGTETQVSIIETLIPEGQKQGFVDAWLEHADKVRIYVEHSHKGFGDIDYPPNIKEDLPCEKPFNEMAVYWDGKVALCNHDWNSHNSLGDLNTQTIMEVWNGQYYDMIRQMHSYNGRRVLACKDCDYWMTSYLPKKMFGELYVNG